MILRGDAFDEPAEAGLAAGCRVVVQDMAFGRLIQFFVDQFQGGLRFRDVLGADQFQEFFNGFS